MDNYLPCNVGVPLDLSYRNLCYVLAELQRYGGGPIDPSSLEGAAVSQMDSRFGMNSSGNNFGDGDESLPAYPDAYPQAGSMRQSSGHLQQQTTRSNSGTGSKSSAIWKGPTSGISTIYGDWLEDIDWNSVSQPKYGQPVPFAGQKSTESSGEPLARKDSDQQRSSPYLKPSNGSARIYAQGSQGLIQICFPNFVALITSRRPDFVGQLSV